MVASPKKGEFTFRILKTSRFADLTVTQLFERWARKRLSGSDSHLHTKFGPKAVWHLWISLYLHWRH
jgi:hypothetical protein